MTKQSQIDVDSPDLIESIIKRKGGTTVSFGHGHHVRTEYHFAPLNGKDGAPHVCVVSDKTHQTKLLAIKEGFRFFNEQQDQLAESDAASDLDDVSSSGSVGSDQTDYNDLLGINADTVSAAWLQTYAKDHLNVSPKAKADIAAYAHKNWTVELDTTATATNLLREVLKLEQQDQLAESDAAKLENS